MSQRFKRRINALKKQLQNDPVHHAYRQEIAEWKRRAPAETDALFAMFAGELPTDDQRAAIEAMKKRCDAVGFYSYRAVVGRLREVFELVDEHGDSVMVFE